MEETMVAMAATVLFALNVLSSALLAGLIAIALTKTVATWGGLVGGFVSSTPTLVIPLSLGMALACNHSVTALNQAMWISPVGIFLASTFLVMWRILPLALPKPWPRRLPITVAISLFCWLSGAVVCYFAIGALQRVAHMPIQAIGGGALLCNFALSAPVACIKAAPVPKSEKAVSSGTYALRGSLAASVVSAAVLVSRWDPALAGIGAGFPAIALASLVSLWISRGERVVAGAIGPIMLGGLSASTYCIAFGTLYAILFGAGLGQPLSLLLALSASYLSSVVMVSMPVFVLFSWVAAITRKRRSRQLETAEEEGVMVEEEDEDSCQLNNRGAVMTEWTKGETTPLLLAATTSGHHPTYHACSSGENDWKGREDCVSRLAVRRHLSEETEQRIKMKGHERLSSHDPDHNFDEPGQGDETDKKKKNNEETRRWADVVVVDTRLREANVTTTEPAALPSSPAMTAGSCAVAVAMGGAGEVEGKLQPTPNQRTLTPLR